MAERRDDPSNPAHDESRVRDAFRALPPLEPPAALDDAIRAAARRAVAAGPVADAARPARRWAMPVSVAAVMALAIGVALHVDRETPVIADGSPVAPPQEIAKPAAKEAAVIAAPEGSAGTATREEPRAIAKGETAAIVARPTPPVPLAKDTATMAAPPLPSREERRAANAEPPAAPPPAYRPEPPRGYSYAPPRHDDGYGRRHCLPSEAVRSRLVHEGWTDFRGVELREDVAVLEARRPGGDLYRLNVDRCSGEILKARVIQPGAPGPYAYTPSPYRYGPGPYATAPYGRPGFGPGYGPGPRYYRPY